VICYQRRHGSILVGNFRGWKDQIVVCNSGGRNPVGAFACLCSIRWFQGQQDRQSTSWYRQAMCSIGWDSYPCGRFMERRLSRSLGQIQGLQSQEQHQL